MLLWFELGFFFEIFVLCEYSSGQIQVCTRENVSFESISFHSHVVSEAQATCAINECLSALYREGLFIPSERAGRIADQGLQFLRLYAEVATICFNRKQKRFPFTPKGHYLHHQFLQLLHQSRRQTWCINMLIFAVQMEEDYIGKPSRLARRVSCKTTSLRVIQRTFLAMNMAMGDMDDDDEK